MISRRRFLSNASAAAAAVTILGRSSLGDAEPLGLPLGLQLFSVRQQMAKDFDGTLAQISSLGYRDVEAAGFFQHSAADVKQSMQKANLRCVSSHVPFSDLQPNFDERLAFNKELGVEYLICSSPGFKTPAAAGSTNRGRVATLEDWHYNAEQFNLMGEKAAAAGLRFGYHNHVDEFTPVEGVVPFIEMLRQTDPTKVTFEMDCGWVVVGGAKPVDLLRDYPGRFSLLHIKDFKSGKEAGPNPHNPTVTELGIGSIDYRPIFQQASRTQKIKHLFIEQEAFDIPWMKSLKVDADYMRNLKA